MLTILLVDGDALTRALTAPALRTAGHQVLEAGAAEEAAAALAAGTPDFVVVDGAVPGVDGLLWVEGQRTRHPHVQFLLTGAFWRAQATARADAEAPVVKPATPAELHRRISEVLAAVARPRVATPVPLAAADVQAAA